MKSKDSIKITSKLHSELCTNITVKAKNYTVMTEYSGDKNHIITTKVYHGGKILSTENTERTDLSKASDKKVAIGKQMQLQHERVIKDFREKNEQNDRTPSEYLDEVKTLLKKKDLNAAINLLESALRQFPDNPFLLSYYGCLEGIINKKFSYGRDICLSAIEILNERIPFGKEVFYPVFYLNLGRVYLAAGNKKEAIITFQKGLSFDRENKDLMTELAKLGIRRKPLVPYLKRSNPINKYIGITLHRLRKVSS